MTEIDTRTRGTGDYGLRRPADTCENSALPIEIDRLIVNAGGYQHRIDCQQARGIQRCLDGGILSRHVQSLRHRHSGRQLRIKAHFTSQRRVETLASITEGHPQAIDGSIRDMEFEYSKIPAFIIAAAPITRSVQTRRCAVERPARGTGIFSHRQVIRTW